MYKEKEKEGRAILKNKFYEGLILTTDEVKYEKKVIELYDPGQEYEEDYLLVDEDEEKESDYWDDIEDLQDDVFNTYSITKIQFSNKRINQKFDQLVFRYKDIIDRETLFGFCIDIIEEFIHQLDGEYIYVSESKVNKDGKDAYHDDVSTINMMLDTRINRKIDYWRGTYREEKDGIITYYAPKFAESLDTELFPNSELLEDDDSPKTIGDMVTNKHNLFYDDVVSDKELNKRLEKIYAQANLTDREIEVLQALERTTDNVNGGIYTKAHAGELLDCTGQNISNIFNKVKKKVMDLYRKENRLDKLNELNIFLDSIENEKEIINFILENLGKNFIYYLLYESNLEGDLTRYFNVNNPNIEMHHTDTMREFCTYFIKEVYDYKRLVKYNLMMEGVAPTPPKEVEKYKRQDKNDIYVYKVWHKLEEYQRKGNFIMIDNEKYFYVIKEEQKEMKETKGNYKTLTYLKR